MKSTAGIGLSDVQGVYGGPEGELWELIMGEQIHIGGFQSSMDLAEKANIGAGMNGVDLCSCNGGGIRFLLRYRDVARMTGVDATPKVLELARARCQKAGLADRADFVLADACNTNLPSEAADFVWGEDAWCYVTDKPALIAEAVRLVRPGGLIAFTDWVEGDNQMTDQEAERYLKFMKFPSVLTTGEYSRLLEENHCRILITKDTGRFAACVDLYLNMVEVQLMGDALRILDHNMALLEAVAGEMRFLRDLAHAGKIAQGLVVAQRQ